MKTFALIFALAATLHAAPPESKFRAVTIDDKIQIGYGVAVADVDGDKRPDILLADKKQIVWYQNPGQPPPGAESFAPSVWSKFVIAENLTEHDNVCLAAQDIDGDGKCEIAVGAEWNPGDTVNSGAVFYLIPPEDRTQKWEPVKFPSVEPTTHRMKWLRLGEKEWGLVVVPLHGRGNKNGEGEGVHLVIYFKPTDPRREWRSELIDGSMHLTHNFSVAPYFGGGMAIVVAGKEGLKKFVRGETWLHERNDLAVTITRPDQSEEASPSAGEIRPCNMNGEHVGVLHVAIEPMHGNTLAVYSAARDGGTKHSRHVLTDKLTEGHALACGDLLGAGGDQIVVGWRGTAGKEGSTIGVHVWTALNDAGKDWRDSAVDDGGMACEDLVLADLNGDGKLDIVASGRATHNVKVYFNETPR